MQISYVYSLVNNYIFKYHLADQPHKYTEKTYQINKTKIYLFHKRKNIKIFSILSQQIRFVIQFLQKQNLHNIIVLKPKSKNIFLPITYLTKYIINRQNWRIAKFMVYPLFKILKHTYKNI